MKPPINERWALWNIDKKEFVYRGTVDAIQEKFKECDSNFSVARFRGGKWRFLSLKQKELFKTMLSSTGTVITFGEIEEWSYRKGSGRIIKPVFQ